MGRAATANVVPLPKKLPTTGLVCSGCGARASASCNCGKPYLPAAAVAKAALERDPEKSDRAIAAEIGVHQTTVSRTRKKSGDANASPAKRVGKDGKKYTAKRKSKPRKAKAKSPQNDIERAREFGSGAASHAQRVTEEFYPWLEKAELPDEALQSLVQMFNVAAAQYTALAEAAAEKMR